MFKYLSKAEVHERFGKFDDTYTIEPFDKFFSDIACGGQGCLIAGDVIDMITGATIVGPYCEWPKRERKEFVIVSGRSGGKTEAMRLAIDRIKEIEPTVSIKEFKKKKDWQHRYPWEK